MARVTVEDCLDKVDNRFQLVLVATNAGRFAGLDFFVDTFFQGYLAKVKQGTSNGSET